MEALRGMHRDINVMLASRELLGCGARDSFQLTRDITSYLIVINVQQRWRDPYIYINVEMTSY